jgi:glycosyltransferase involved in cell wall biosynthesis
MYKRINYVCNNVDIIYTVSDGMIDVIKSYGITTPVKVIKNATEMVPFDKPKEIIDEINKKYKINEDTFVFVFCARMVKIKNLQMIIDTFKVLNKKYQDYKFFICGDGPDLE